MSSTKTCKRIVIVGGGAGGLILATKLGRFAKKSNTSPLKITLIDLSTTHIWKPLLHEVAAGTLDSFADEISYFSHASKNGYEFIQGCVSSVSGEENSVTIDPIVDDRGNIIRHTVKVPFDTLILAAGSVANDFDIPGVKENCYLLDSRTEADRLHKQISAHLLALKYDPQTSQTEPFIISVIGGGATGVELAAELMSAIETLSKLHQLDNLDELVKIQIIEAGDTLLPGQDPKSIQVAESSINELKIVVHNKTKVTRIEHNLIHAADGMQLASDVHIWTSGIKAPQFIRDINLTSVNKLGQVIVDSHLKVMDCSNIFAIGDCAEFTFDGKRLAPRAQVAQQQAIYLSQILSTTSHQPQPSPPFIFKERGSIFSLGTKVAVGSMPLGGKNAIRFKGYIAKLAYISLYRKHQIEVLGFRRGLVALIKAFFGRLSAPRVKLH